MLCDPSSPATELGTVYVMPERKIKKAKDTNPLDGRGGPKTSVDETPDYTVWRYG